ncbi:hypothetical protein TSAR_007426 [Trichomalopsis sarcophagae]|uniref:THAP-type domain-containing protein n=1 Tax=Trichomalopsis sarcophagae TaxID=543379 RepID=A0A232FDT5_9HYME|nr:hypothetical protein TSAR_007426 [Trichomalopsis sarcophagae]
MIKCHAKGCTSNEKIEIDGEKLEFYPFPVDKNLRNQWKRICVTSKDKKKPYLCELHFCTSAFDSARQLKPDAVPTIESLKSNTNYETVTVSDSEPASKKSKSLDSDDVTTSKAKPFRLTVEIKKIVSRPSPLSENRTKPQEETVFIENGTDKQNSLQCLVCKESFSDITDLYSHNKTHFTCNICNIEFTSRNNYENHSQLHKSNMDQRLYKCDTCELLFESKDELSKHIHSTVDSNDDEETRIQYCGSCKMTFSDEVLFSDHLNTHLGSWYVDAHE